MSADPTGWDGILEQGEKILWQGRPGTNLRIKPSQFTAILFGLFFSGFALFWMVMAFQAGGFFWMFGLIHFAVGLSIGIGPVYKSVIRRKNTWYTLSDRRAFIATAMPVVGRRITSYPISANTSLDYQQTTPPSIYFAHEYKQGKNRSRRIDIGFEAIDDGRKVLALMRGIQKAIPA